MNKSFTGSSSSSIRNPIQISSQGNFDVVVIGGGATGLGTALDSASRGYSTLLLEQDDFCKGTSSRSTKLIHGGVRYLRQGNLSLVKDSLRERGLLLRNAPHLVRPLKFVIPVYRRWETPYYWLGLKAYDWLAGDLGLGAAHAISLESVCQVLPTLRHPSLRGGLLYHDAQFDDARLGISLLRAFLKRGGKALNYARVTGFAKRQSRITGVLFQDRESGVEMKVGCRAAINATGIFADTLRRLDDPACQSLITVSQGIHLVFDDSYLPGDHALMVPRTDDGRVLFAIPWKGTTLIGTTDTPREEIGLEPRPLDQEIDFLLDHAGRYLQGEFTRRNVRCCFAGLRPLLGSAGDRTSRLSRDHLVKVSASGLTTITGGKWTTYRRMAQDAVDRAVEESSLEPRESATEDLRLAEQSPQSGHWRFYGDDAGELLTLVEQDPSWEEPLHPRHPFLQGEVVWAVRQEMARSVEDVLSRRLRLLVLDARAAIEAAPKVAGLMARELGWDSEQQQIQIARFLKVARGYLPT